MGADTLVRLEGEEVKFQDRCRAACQCVARYAVNHNVPDGEQPPVFRPRR